MNDQEGAASDDSEDLPCSDPADALLQRGEHLRKLRELERQDEEARAREASNDDEQSDHHTKLIQRPSGASFRLLDYEAYLQHQRYYDDLKHIDCRFIDYGRIGAGRLVVEQEKNLGKGGWAWDAAFVLGEYLIQEQVSWIRLSLDDRTTLLELGSGTGLCGMMVAKAVSNVEVNLTDLPELLNLLGRNMARNFATDQIGESNNVDDDEALEEYCKDDPDSKCSCSQISAFSLVWGDDCSRRGTFDVVVGADVVASIYDPDALLQSIASLTHSESVVYISFKERLSSIHQRFEKGLRSLFDEVEVTEQTHSRNRNPDVKILIARNKRDVAS